MADGLGFPTSYPRVTPRTEPEGPFQRNDRNSSRSGEGCEIAGSIACFSPPLWRSFVYLRALCGKGFAFLRS